MKDLHDTPTREASRIRRAWWPLRLSGRNLGFDLPLESPSGHQERLAEGGPYYREIVSKGLRLV